LYCVSELDVAVVDVSPSLFSEPKNINDPNFTTKSNFCCPVELALEIKYSPCDLIKAANQEVVFSNTLVDLAIEKEKVKLATAQQQQPNQNQKNVEQQLFGYILLTPWLDDRHPAFYEDTLPSITQRPGKQKFVSFKQKEKTNWWLRKKKTEKTFALSLTSFNQWSREEVARHHAAAVAKEQKRQQTQHASSVAPPIQNFSTSPATTQNPQTTTTSQLFATSAAAAVSSFSPTTTSQPQQQQQQQQQHQYQTFPYSRFFLVSQWSNPGSEAKYFPVYGPLKHLVVRSIASLLASGNWRGVSPSSSSLSKYSRKSS